MNKINVGISGISGKMGRNVLEILRNNAETFNITAGFHSTDISIEGVRCYSDLKDFLSNIDLCIDFSSRDTLMHLVEVAESNSCFPKIVSGTTGLTDEDIKVLRNYANNGAVFWAPNFSIGISIFKDLLGYILPKILEYDYDMELLEKHHRFKKDAPSGTALAILNQIAKFQNKNLDDVVHMNSIDAPVRPSGKTVGVSFQRGGGIIGEHELSFVGQFEEIVIKHTAFDRKVFANGAVTAAKWLLDKDNGYFGMADMLK